MSNDWLSKRRDEWITIYLSNTIFPDTTRIAMEGAWNAALEALRSSPVEFDLAAAEENSGSRFGEEWAIQREIDFVDGARWQFERDRERIAVAEALLKSAIEQNDKQRERIAELTEALEFYADHDNWAQIPGKLGVYPVILGDCDERILDVNTERVGGKRARQALGRKAGE